MNTKVNIDCSNLDENQIKLLDSILEYLKAKQQNNPHSSYFTTDICEEITGVMDDTQYEELGDFLVKCDLVKDMGHGTIKAKGKGLSFDGFAKERDRWIKRNRAKLRSEWYKDFNNKISVYYTLLMTLVAIISTGILIYNFFEDRKDKLLIKSKELTIDSLLAKVKYYEVIQMKADNKIQISSQQKDSLHNKK